MPALQGPCSRARADLSQCSDCGSMLLGKYHGVEGLVFFLEFVDDALEPFEFSI